jgi:microcystin-dependent protein
MAVSILSPVSMTSFYSPEDGTVRQASLWFYKTQTLDPIPVYTDANLGIPHSQPVLTGGSGRVPPVFIGEVGLYRIRTFDQFDVLIEDIDGLPSAVAPVEGGGGTPPDPVDPLLLMKTGAIVPFYADEATTIIGYVRCNGGTISATAGAPVGSERANDDAMALFKWLWAQDPRLPVVPTRGTSADGDWTAKKAITLPDFRGRALVGVTGQGGGTTTRLDGVTWNTGGSATLIGSFSGAVTCTLTVANMPGHAHTVPDHVHPMTSHQHVVPDHTHIQTAHQHLVSFSNSTVVQAAGFGFLRGNSAGTSTNFIEATLSGPLTHTSGIEQPGSLFTGYSAAMNTLGSGSFGTDLQGGGTAHEITQPFILVSYFIKL